MGISFNPFRSYLTSAYVRELPIFLANLKLISSLAQMDGSIDSHDEEFFSDQEFPYFRKSLKLSCGRKVVVSRGEVTKSTRNLHGFFFLL